MTGQADIGLIGLAVMGRNLALNIADRDVRVAVHNRTGETTRHFLASAEAAGRPLVGTSSLEELVAALVPPRAIVLMVKAGAPTDAQIDALAPLLEAGDVVVDGGNAHFADTMRREKALARRGLMFLGTGISGGEEGARHGPAIMAGGAPEAYARLKPVFEAIAARVDDEPCCAHVGPDGAGHFVKMLHNGIEYADMQLIAESYDLMRRLLGMAPTAMADVFARWNEGALDSYLIEITAKILAAHDPETGNAMVDVIRDAAEQKGTGSWTVTAALELGAPVPTIAEAVFARQLSSLKAERERADTAFPPRPALAGEDATPFLADLHDALLAGKLGAYAQGFSAIAAASRAHGWNVDLARVARIWRGGCIIRARFLNAIADAFGRDPTLANLMLDEHFKDILAHSEGGLRRTLAHAGAAGVAVPGLASSLAYLDGYRTARGNANLIQAQRDYFGAHTYERVDRPGHVHTDWSAL